MKSQDSVKSKDAIQESHTFKLMSHVNHAEMGNTIKYRNNFKF